MNNLSRSSHANLFFQPQTIAHKSKSKCLLHSNQQFKICNNFSFYRTENILLVPPFAHSSTAVIYFFFRIFSLPCMFGTDNVTREIRLPPDSICVIILFQVYFNLPERKTLGINWFINHFWNDFDWNCIKNRPWNGAINKSWIRRSPCAV